jgi:hypothetical protein
VAEEGAFANDQQSGDAAAVFGEQFRRDRGVDAAVDRMQPACMECAVDRRPADAGGQQLRAGDDSVLPRRDGATCPGFVPVSGKKSGRFGHPVIVGAPAVPALPAFATTLRAHSR